MPAPDAKRAQARERAREAYVLRHVEGESYVDIGKKLGVSTAHARRLALEGAREVVSEELRDSARNATLAELEALRTKAFRYLNGHYVFAQFGKLVTDDDGKPLQDIGPNLAAMDRLLKIEKRRAEIYGYDAPKRTTVNVVTEDAIMAEINRLEAEMAAADAEAERQQAG